MSLTVIINTFERPDTLKKCLDSLFKQTDKDFRIIVIDQSRDSQTCELCAQYDIKYFQNKNINLSHSRNIGISKASTDLVAFIDDDAEAKHDWVESIKANFENNPQLDILAGKVINNTDEHNPMIQFQNGIVSLYGYIEDVHPVTEHKFDNGFDKWYLRPMGTNMVFKRQCLIDNGGFDEFFEYNHDETDISIRIIKAGGKIKYDDDLVVMHYPAISINRKNKYEINWFVDAKNNVYFAMKNGSDVFMIRIMRAIYRVIGNKGSFSIINKYWRSGEISFFKFIVFSWRSKLGLIKGLWAGIFHKRKLYFK